MHHFDKCSCMTAVAIYVTRGGRNAGPFSKQEIKDQLKAGDLSLNDLAWHEGLAVWQPIKQLEVFAPPTAGTNQSAPPKAELPSTGRIPENVAALDKDLGNSFAMEDGGDLGVAKTVSLFKSLDYGFLLPVRKVFNQGLLRKRAVRWVLFFGLFPLVIWNIARMFNLELSQTLWLFEVYFCFFWALYFHSLIQPGRAIWRKAAAYAVFTAVVGVAILLQAQQLPLIRSLYAGSVTEGSSATSQLFSFVFGVGVFEEACKAAPLLIFGLRKNKIAGVREGLFLGFASGLGFAAAEGVQYGYVASVSGWFGVVEALQNDSRSGVEAALSLPILQTLFRMMTGPILHGAWAGAVGWFIGLAATRKSPRWPIVVVGIALIGGLHGLHDFFVQTPIGILTGVVSILIFMAYLTHDERPASSVEPSLPPP
ncbi:MAG: PrsW family glutamic-type intramembrane protease [Chthoniobacter sp.]